jgi:murein endopeptidase
MTGIFAPPDLKTCFERSLCKAVAADVSPLNFIENSKEVSQLTLAATEKMPARVLFLQHPGRSGSLCGRVEGDSEILRAMNLWLGTDYIYKIMIKCTIEIKGIPGKCVCINMIPDQADATQQEIRAASCLDMTIKAVDNI